MCASKKGISSRTKFTGRSGVMKTAWFMTPPHPRGDAPWQPGIPAPMGGEGKIVEADETYIGKKAGTVKHPTARGYAHKRAVLSLVERGGDVRSFHIDNANAANVYPIIDKNLSFESTLMTDEASLYKTIGRSFADHQTVEHGKDEYVRGDCHTNTLEGYFTSSSAA